MSSILSFNDPGNLPFAVALTIVFILGAIEGVDMLIGAGIFGFLDGLLPDIDIDTDLDLDGPDISATSPVSQFLSWLRLGNVPVIFSLIIFLISFGLVGIGMQNIIFSIIGTRLPSTVAVMPALLLSLPLLRVGNNVLAFILPHDETSAISIDEFVGRTATITIGTARFGYPAQARLKDQHGQTHYLLVAPDNREDVFITGDELLIVRHEDNTFYGIPAPSALM